MSGTEVYCTANNDATLGGLLTVFHTERSLDSLTNVQNTLPVSLHTSIHCRMCLSCLICQELVNPQRDDCSSKVTGMYVRRVALMAAEPAPGGACLRWQGTAVRYGCCKCTPCFYIAVSELVCCLARRSSLRRTRTRSRRWRRASRSTSCPSPTRATARTSLTRERSWTASACSPRR